MLQLYGLLLHTSQCQRVFGMSCWNQSEDMMQCDAAYGYSILYFKKKGAMCKNWPVVTFSPLRMSYYWTLQFWALKIPGLQTEPANLWLCARLTIRGIQLFNCATSSRLSKCDWTEWLKLRHWNVSFCGVVMLKRKSSTIFNLLWFLLSKKLLGSVSLLAVKLAIRTGSSKQQESAGVYTSSTERDVWGQAN